MQSTDSDQSTCEIIEIFSYLPDNHDQPQTTSIIPKKSRTIALFGQQTFSLHMAARKLAECVPYSFEEILSFLEKVEAVTANGLPLTGRLSRSNMMSYAAALKNSLLESNALINFLTQHHQYSQSISIDSASTDSKDQPIPASNTDHMMQDRTDIELAIQSTNEPRKPSNVVPLFAVKKADLNKALKLIREQQKRMDILLALHQLFKLHFKNS